MSLGCDIEQDSPGVAEKGPPQLARRTITTHPASPIAQIWDLCSQLTEGCFYFTQAIYGKLHIKGPKNKKRVFFFSNKYSFAANPPFVTVRLHGAGTEPIR